MIQLLATRYQKHIACFIGLIFYLSIVIPSQAAALESPGLPGHPAISTNHKRFLPAPYNQSLEFINTTRSKARLNNTRNVDVSESNSASTEAAEDKASINKQDKPDIDGPSQPEMSSFKPAGTSDMVNLFTGDFSYNIPLMDVGGYPINIFYDGGVSMEQEASWVGLGWNINPGNVNRNMRGVPDDFNGEEKLTQELKTKPNITWGVRLGADFEFVGIKDFLGFNIGADLGVNFNNYLGPAIEVGIKGGANFSVSGKINSEKSTADTIGSLKVSVGVGGNLSSRYGLTISPNISLTAGIGSTARKTSVGTSLSTSYNSRTGIKDIQLNGQLSFSRNQTLVKHYFDSDGGYIGSSSKNYSSSNSFHLSSSISFVKPTYVPTMRTVNSNSAWSGRFQIGGALWGGYASGEIEVYKQKSQIKGDDVTQKKSMVGFLYAEKAVGNKDAVMDFSRVNDKEVTPTTPVVSAPQYAYDVYSIQGEGTGGSIRLYRNDIGYMKDNYTGSKDESFGLGVDVGIPGHVGANFNLIKTPSSIGDWNLGNKLRNSSVFAGNNRDTQRVYFKNPGESSVIDQNDYTKIGGLDLVRYKLGGTNSSPTAEAVLQRFAPNKNYLGDTYPTGITSLRKRRTQVVSYLTAAEAANVGLETKIRNYSMSTPFDANKNLVFTEISRVGGDRKAHHMSEISVTESDGKRYVYGLPVYNITQQDFTFTVGLSGYGTQEQNEVTISAGETSTSSSPHMSGTGRDGYVEITTTPAYAHSFLLTGLLSPDYVDVGGNGITEDDLGSAVKFNYTYTGEHQWRTPHTAQALANFNPGSRSEIKDDKGIISTGKRESWYLHSIESKSMIALFTLDTRNDGKGILDPVNGGINGGDNSIRCLRKIDLYNKADIKKNGLANARPIKTVHFDYDYSLCKNTRDNTNTGEGKLVLKSIWFTYKAQRQNSLQKNKYLFSYYNDNAENPVENPDFSFNASDRWGNYKPVSSNPDNLPNSLYPYSTQSKTIADINAGVWQLKRILLPSGAEISVQYESDDYAFVQDKRAAVMTGLFGFSNTNINPVISNQLYTVNGTDITENNYVFIKVSEPCLGPSEVYQKYLNGMKQIAFKLAVYMPKGTEYIDCYADIESYDVYNTGQSGVYGIWVSLKKVAGMSPLSLTIIEHMREYLPGQTFEGYDVSESTGLEQIGNMLKGWLQSIGGAFKDLAQYLRILRKGQNVNLLRSFVRITDPDGYKYGGGYRVKKVMMKDNWNKMTNQYTSAYGQQYDYTTTELFNGATRTISSGVASYEPAIGGDENPFQTILRVVNTIPLGPASYGAIEMPVLDAFFPAPSVGYSKVTVTSLGKNQNPDPANKKTRSGVGRQVTEFYTAKDFPVYYDHTSLDPTTDKQVHRSSKMAFFYKWAFDSRAISQGFLVVNNDMHGKLKSQSSYAENDPNTRINYTENFYRNTGKKGFNEKFDFVYNNLSAEVKEGNMGIDVELMTDTREFSVKSSSYDVQGQLDYFPVFIPPVVWLPFIWFVSGNSENTYRAITTTKTVTYHAVLDSVLVIDKGSQVSTKNLVYDAETGQVIVNRTNNEFDKAVYSVSYPAYWAYSGMGLAYKNIDAIYSGVTFYDGVITGGMSSIEIKNIFESGDELYIIEAGSSAGCDPAMASPGTNTLIWALDKNKNNSSLSNPNPNFIFIDKDGKPYTRTGVKFRIIRSGHRNMLMTSLAAVTLQTNPVKEISPGLRKLVVNSNSKTIAATAMEFREKWQTDNDVFRRYKTITITSAPPELAVNGSFSAGNTGFSTNYYYCNTNPTPGCYRVSLTSSGWFGTAPACYDHTAPGTGNMMQIDGGNSFNTVWSQPVNVTPNTNYIFSAWIASINEVNTPTPVGKIQFLINGNGIGAVHSANVGPCSWKQVSASWNSGNNTSVTIGILNIDWSGAGNDYALDDISFKATDAGCTTQEVEDCSGYLEKQINPYRKGLLGNFRGYRNMVFYGERMESDPLVPTNLPVNGYLKDFSPYWSFDANSNMVPDISPASKWVWNTQTTRVNSKGLEMENKDALGIFTAAQYGYQKTVPLAIASNSRINEMFFDSFEDYGYAETLNGAQYNVCSRRHMDFSLMPGAQIMNTDNTGAAAHTGKYYLQLDNTDTLTLPVSNTVNESFTLNYEPGIADIYLGGGPNFFRIENCSGNSSIQVPQNTYTAAINDMTAISVGYCTEYIFKFYLKANATTSYPFNSFITENGGSYDISVSVVDEKTGSTSQVYTYSQAEVLNGPPQSYINHDFYVQMCAGKYYYVEMTYHPNPLFVNYPYYWMGNPNPYWAGVTYYSSGLDEYEYIYAQGGSCTYTKPVPGSESMMNPVFSVPVSKKMVFSAWVKESCGNPQGGIPCTLKTYTQNEVQIDFGGSSPNNVTIKPTGPIIEGWQRYEGYFTAPAGISSMNVVFVNSSGAPLYYDDIRIHPFNSNMKSYVYDPVNLRLTSELDANNYASFYEYDEEGTLIRTKVETREGVKTVTESRSARQKNITNF